MQPTIGEIVHYKLTQSDADAINWRRTHSASIERRIEAPTSHIAEGDCVPLIITRVWPKEFGDDCGVNGQAILDGTDSLWVTSVREGDQCGTWKALNDLADCSQTQQSLDNIIDEPPVASKEG